MGKPAIYVGGVLQMYFGILGQRWVRERPDILRMYLNEPEGEPAVGASTTIAISTTNGFSFGTHRFVKSQRTCR